MTDSQQEQQKTQQEKEEEAERIRLWIQHLKWVKKHPKREDPAEFYQKEIDRWEAKLQSLKER